MNIPKRCHPWTFTQKPLGRFHNIALASRSVRFPLLSRPCISGFVSAHKSSLPTPLPRSLLCQGFNSLLSFPECIYQVRNHSLVIFSKVHLLHNLMKSLVGKIFLKNLVGCVWFLISTFNAGAGYMWFFITRLWMWQWRFFHRARWKFGSEKLYFPFKGKYYFIH